MDFNFELIDFNECVDWFVEILISEKEAMLDLVSHQDHVQRQLELLQ